MTLGEIYKEGKNILKNANIDNYSFDVMCIIGHCFNLKRHDLSVQQNRTVSNSEKNIFFKLIEKRKNHYPLQYILGQCNFMGNEFKIGEGVLIPRDDTEVLVNASTDILKCKENANVLDLCSGSGIVAISLAKKFKNTHFFSVELSNKAISYLLSNIKTNHTKNVTPIKYDVLDSKLAIFRELKYKFDLIVSNPPYINSNDIITLQKEVQNEPKMALDGGEDGLVFYRAIAENWTQLLKNNGSICVEIGMGQKDSVVDIFRKAGLKDVNSRKDINGIDRVVCATKY